MGFWKNVFGKKSPQAAGAKVAPQSLPPDGPAETRTPAVAGELPDPPLPGLKGLDWYFAEDGYRNLRQVVVEIQAPDWKESEFGNLLLAAKYKFLITSGWTVNYFRTDSTPGPYLMIRTDHIADKVKSCKLRLGFTFIRMQRSGLMALYVEFLPRPTPDCNPFIELVSGLDIQDYRDRISDAYAKDTLDIVLADRGNMSVTFMDETGSSESHVAPLVVGEINLPVDPELKATLQREWRGLLAYHDKIPPNQVNHIQAVNQLWEVMPEDQSPLLKRKQ